MFRRFAAVVARPQSVLIVLGYSFGDEGAVRDSG
jgi:hypothetical protein